MNSGRSRIYIPASIDIIFMVDKRLIDYLRNGISKGLTTESLRKTLVRQGWQVSDVDNAIAAVQNPTASQKNTESHEGGTQKGSNKKYIVIIGIVIAVSIVVPIALPIMIQLSQPYALRGMTADFDVPPRMIFCIDGDIRISVVNQGSDIFEENWIVNNIKDERGRVVGYFDVTTVWSGDGRRSFWSSCGGTCNPGNYTFEIGTSEINKKQLSVTCY